MSAVSGGADIVEIDVVLRARVDEGSTQQQQQQDLEESIQDLADDLLGGEDGQDIIDKLPQSIQNLDDILGGLDKQALGNLKSFAGNPQGTIQNGLIGALGSAGVYGALATTIIGLVISSPEVFKAFVKFLGQKGGPLNQDYRRDFANETQTGIDRELQFRRSIGLDVIITDQDKDFVLDDPAFVSNSLVNVEITRHIRISTNETTYGYANGI